MVGVSSGPPKHGPPAHPNRHAFKHNPASRLTANILAMPISSHLCGKCQAVLEWRKRFRKYKPLTVAKKCVGCGDKQAVKQAYHVICAACAAKDNKCPKCLTLKTNLNDGSQEQPEADGHVELSSCDDDF